MAVASLTLLSACSSGSDGATSTPPPKAPTVIPTGQTSGTTPTGSSRTGAEAAAWARVPKPARQHTMAGAQAFAEFYVTQTNQAWRQADPSLVSWYATAGCRSCRNYQDTAESLKSKQRHYAGDAVSIRAGAWLPESTRDRVFVSLVLTQRAASIIDSLGKTVDTVERANANSTFDVVWSGGRWRIDSIKVDR